MLSKVLEEKTAYTLISRMLYVALEILLNRGERRDEKKLLHRISLLPIAGKIKAAKRRASEWFFTMVWRTAPRRFPTKYPALRDASTVPMPLYVTCIFDARIGMVGPINSKWKLFNITEMLIFVFDQIVWNSRKLTNMIHVSKRYPVLNRYHRWVK